MTRVEEQMKQDLKGQLLGKRAGSLRSLDSLGSGGLWRCGPYFSDGKQSRAPSSFFAG